MIINPPFIHELSEAKNLFEIIAAEQGILPTLIEKDYWIMHCLWGLQQNGYQFELKGGTSLSKGFNIINRFSKDIDVLLHPDETTQVKTGKNHDKPAHIESRREFFDQIAQTLKVPHLP